VHAFLGTNTGESLRSKRKEAYVSVFDEFDWEDARQHYDERVETMTLMERSARQNTIQPC
jgi:hypothetical protein